MAQKKKVNKVSGTTGIFLRLRPDFLRCLEELQKRFSSATGTDWNRRDVIEVAIVALHRKFFRHDTQADLEEILEKLGKNEKD